MAKSAKKILAKIMQRCLYESSIFFKDVVCIGWVANYYSFFSYGYYGFNYKGELMYKNAIGLRIRENKENIIAMYKKGAILQEMADEYNVVISTIYRYLKMWGHKVNRKKHVKKIRVNNFRRKFSAEFLAHRAINTATNDNSEHYKHYEKEDTADEFNRIHPVTKRRL